MRKALQFEYKKTALSMRLIKIYAYNRASAYNPVSTVVGLSIKLHHRRLLNLATLTLIRQIAKFTSYVRY